MSTPYDHFLALQDAVVARLQDPAAVDVWNKPAPLPVTAGDREIPILSESKGDIGSLLETSLDSMGIALIVLTPLGRFVQEGSQALDLLSPLQVQIQENVTQNQDANVGTQVHALALVAFCLRRLHQWPHGIYGAQRRPLRIAAQATPFTLLSAEKDQLIYNCDFLAPINLNLDLKA